MADVIVIAGTSDGRQIVSELLKQHIEVAATVTTGFGAELIGDASGLFIYEGKLGSDEMVCLIKKEGARCLVDASHPFAKAASENAIKAATDAGIPYIRFEREASDSEKDNTIKVGSYEDAAVQASQFDGNIFLSTGSNSLETFVRLVPNYRERLYVRVLPDSKIIKKCEDLGLTAANIFAARGPFSEELNVAMLKHCKAKVLVTKESGEAGGTLEKLKAAKKCDISVIMIERPKIDYSKVTSSISEVIEWVERLLAIS